MPVNWDTIIAILILGGLFLSIWARMTNQTIIELVRDIRDFLAETREDSVEEIAYYDY